MTQSEALFREYIDEKEWTKRLGKDVNKIKINDLRQNISDYLGSEMGIYWIDYLNWLEDRIDKK